MEYRRKEVGVQLRLGLLVEDVLGEEAADTDGHDVDRHAADDLIDLVGDGGHRVDQAHDDAGDDGHQQSHPDALKGDRSPYDRKGGHRHEAL